MEKVLTFFVENELYGIEVQHIQEVIESPALHYVPKAPGICLGAISFHGEIVPVIDLPVTLGFEAAETDHRVVVLSSGYDHLALAVRELGKIVLKDPDQLMPIQEDENEMRACIRSVINLEPDVINLLDLDRLSREVEDAFDTAGG